jgi:hypothetical protein
MHQPLIPSRVILTLAAASLLMPVIICVVLGVAALLGAMGDAAGGCVLQRIALGCGILWVVNLITLVVLLAIGTLRGPGEPDDTE